MNSPAYFSTDDAGPDGQSTKAELWGLLGALIALKAIFAVAILLFGTDSFRGLSSMAGQVAMHWMLVTAVLIAAPVMLLRRTNALPRTEQSEDTGRQLKAAAGFAPPLRTHARKG